MIFVQVINVHSNVFHLQLLRPLVLNVQVINVRVINVRGSQCSQFRVVLGETYYSTVLVTSKNEKYYHLDNGASLTVV